jgi:hypothetical protein
MPHLRIALLGVAALGFVLPLAIPVAVGQHFHPPQHADLHEQFYSNWYRPDQPAVSCCNLMDCAPAEARMVNGQWMARKEGDARWYTVPPGKIEHNRSSPDGRNHLCAMGDSVYCFVVGGGI